MWIAEIEVLFVIYLHYCVNDSYGGLFVTYLHCYVDSRDGSYLICIVVWIVEMEDLVVTNIHCCMDNKDGGHFSYLPTLLFA